ncbi:MAG: hypothetical protein V4659_09535 [Pseudomonadota bacterium]
MKLLGIDPATMVLHLPQGAPYHLILRVKNAVGDYQAISGRDLALTLYRDNTAFSSVAGTIGSDPTGPFAAFALAGAVSIGLKGSCFWELAELFDDGKTPLLTGAVIVSRSAPSATGDGLYSPSSAPDDITWSPSGEVLVITERGPRGPAAEGIDPGDLTLIFDNHLI